jgi:hypothetical protein
MGMFYVTAGWTSVTRRTFAIDADTEDEAVEMMQSMLDTDEWFREDFDEFSADTYRQGTIIDVEADRPEEEDAGQGEASVQPIEA